MIVCDTGPQVTPALSNDSDHRACVELFTVLHAARRELLVLATVIAEGGYLLESGPAPVRDLRPYREGWLAGRVREGIRRHSGHIAAAEHVLRSADNCEQR